MFYTLYDTQRRLASPWLFGAQAMRLSLTSSQSWLSAVPFAQQWAASIEMTERLLQDYPKPSFDIHHVTIDDIPVPVVEQTVLDTPFCNLVRFKRYCDDDRVLKKLKNAPTVLVVAPLSGHYATLLRDTVTTLLQDHKVYITDWKNARDVSLEHGDFSLDDYVVLVQQFLNHIGDAHVLAVCQPVVPVLGAVSLMSSRGDAAPKSMTLIGGPIDARQSPTAVNNLATQQTYEWFEQNVIHTVPTEYKGAGRKVYPGFLQHMGFVAMNPERHMKAHWDFYENLVQGDLEDAQTHRDFYDEYNAVLDMPAQYYLDTIEHVFQKFSLADGHWHVKGNKVTPCDISSTALLTIEGGRDDIAGQGQTQAAHDLCVNIPLKNKKHLLCQHAGHYGLFSGRRWRNDIYPQLRDFISTHD